MAVMPAAILKVTYMVLSLTPSNEIAVDRQLDEFIMPTMELCDKAKDPMTVLVMQKLVNSPDTVYEITCVPAAESDLAAGAPASQ